MGCDEEYQGNTLKWEWTAGMGQCIYSTHDKVALIVGMCSISIWLVALLPQIVATCLVGSADSVSGWFWFAWMLGDTSNLIGCLLVPDNIVTNTALACTYLFFTSIGFSQVMYFKFLKPYFFGTEEHSCAKEAGTPMEASSLREETSEKSVTITATASVLYHGAFAWQSSAKKRSSRTGSLLNTHMVEIIGTKMTRTRSLVELHTLAKIKVVPAALQQIKSVSLSADLRNYEQPNIDVVLEPHMVVDFGEDDDDDFGAMGGGRLSSDDEHLFHEHQLDGVDEEDISASPPMPLTPQTSTTHSRIGGKNMAMLPVAAISVLTVVCFFALNSAPTPMTERSFSLMTNRIDGEDMSTTTVAPGHGGDKHKGLSTSETIGLVFGWMCGVIYTVSRLPQIARTIRIRDVSGLSPLFFSLTFCGNFTQFCSMLIVRRMTTKVFIDNVPWLVGSGIAGLEDLCLVALILHFSKKMKKKTRKEPSLLK